MAFVSAFLFNFTHSIANTFANHCAHSVIQCNDASYFHPPKDVSVAHTRYEHTLSLNTLSVKKHRVQDIALDSVTFVKGSFLKGTLATIASKAEKLELIVSSMRGAEPELFKLPFILFYTGSCYTPQN
ncbi:hypothetical protein [Pseudoalteromonas sp. MSK9-3]|uniref:hypothetical protein n=1 Tax=Pseudoalteromonas sp. MSK9-3 TaxID=1897633 RepID=UPI0011C3D84C|nr:hypothetical protein [Pseudoalteromonas sp. MSK9-3]